MRDAVVEQKCFPVSLSQQRLWILNQLEPGIAAYQITACLRLTGPLALGALERSLDAIVDRHEALRTTFDVCRGALLQVIEFVLRDSPADSGHEYQFRSGVGGAGLFICA